jgi:hypothetical protein
MVEDGAHDRTRFIAFRIRQALPRQGDNATFLSDTVSQKLIVVMLQPPCAGLDVCKGTTQYGFDPNDLILCRSMTSQLQLPVLVSQQSQWMHVLQQVPYSLWGMREKAWRESSEYELCLSIRILDMQTLGSNTTNAHSFFRLFQININQTLCAFSETDDSGMDLLSQTKEEVNYDRSIVFDCIQDYNKNWTTRISIESPHPSDSLRPMTCVSSCALIDGRDYDITLQFCKTHLSIILKANGHDETIHCSNCIQWQSETEAEVYDAIPFAFQSYAWSIDWMRAEGRTCKLS